MNLEALARGTRIDLRARRRRRSSVFLDGEDVTTAIRTPEVSQAASKIAVRSGRAACAGSGAAARGAAGRRGDGRARHRQRGFPRRGPENISDGVSGDSRRAPVATSISRREMRSTCARTLEEIHERDRRDRERRTSPLVRAPDAVVVDSTAMESEEVARLVVMLAKSRTAGQPGRSLVEGINRGQSAYWPDRTPLAHSTGLLRTIQESHFPGFAGAGHRRL